MKNMPTFRLVRCGGESKDNAEVQSLARIANRINRTL